MDTEYGIRKNIHPNVSNLDIAKNARLTPFHDHGEGDSPTQKQCLQTPGTFLPTQNVNA
jgi:hypothetical protein